MLAAPTTAKLIAKLPIVQDCRALLLLDGVADPYGRLTMGSTSMYNSTPMKRTHAEGPVDDAWLPLSVFELEPLVASEERLLDMACVLVPVALVKDVDIVLA